VQVLADRTHVVLEGSMELRRLTIPLDGSAGDLLVALQHKA